MAAYRYFRLKITGWKNNGSDNTGDVRVQEWQLVDAGSAVHPAAPMTGPSSPAPLVASSSTNDGSRPAWRVFDGSVTGDDRWISASSDAAPYLQIDLGSGNEIELASIKIAPDDAAQIGGGYFITAFQVLGSSTGAFSGEEAVVIAESGLTTGWVNYTFRQFYVPLYVSGVVHDDVGAPCARVVRLYRRDTGALLAEQTSDAVTGEFEFATAYNGDCIVMVLDDAAGTQYNAIVFDKVVPA